MIRSSRNTQEMLKLNYLEYRLPNDTDELDRKRLGRCFCEDFANFNQGFLQLLHFFV